MRMHFAALRYLDQWFEVEAPICDDLRSRSDKNRRSALVKAATFFGVAGNFPTEYDEGLGLARYQPVIEAIRGLPRGPVGDVDRLVSSFATTLSRRYGGNSLLSASSKILWLSYGDPVVIYDRRARIALGFQTCTYSEYRKAWERRWAKQAPVIRSACLELPTMLRYAACGGKVSPNDVMLVASTPWFQRRVLDIALWTEGDA